jgi:hypothetical protein
MTSDERYLLLLYRSCDEDGKRRILRTSEIYVDILAEEREETCFLDTTTKKHVTEDGRQKTEILGFCIDGIKKKW